MQSKAHLKIIRTSARKVRLVADTVRGESVVKALGKLEYDLRSSAPVIAKLIRSAVANAKNNFDYKGDGLMVSVIEVGEGPTLKRFRARAHGRAGKINKRTSRITVTLSDESNDQPASTKKVTKATTTKQEAAKPTKKAAAKTTTKATTKKADTKKSDDLTKIEGIGPVIAQTLVAANVDTFAKLSKKSSEDIQKIIADVRGNHDSQTWTEQAQLAADGKWDKLKVWQDELNGGKEESK